jgi:hypothetical protein
MLSRNAVRLALEISSQMTKEQQIQFGKEIESAQEGDNQGDCLQQSDIRDLAEKILNN